MKKRDFAPEEIRFLRGIASGRRWAEVIRMFNERFSAPISQKHIRRLAREGWLKNDFRVNKVRHVGDSKIDRKGYELVKTGPNKSDWKYKHVMIWEAANGKAPKGHCVIFADGNRQNFALENLLLVSRAEAAHMNKCGLRSADPDVTRLGLAMAKMRLNAAARVKKEFGVKLELYEARQRREGKNEAR